jgi:hypothetical protein
LIGDLQDEIHPGVVILEFTGSAVLDQYCRSGLLAAIAPKDGAPTAGFMQ